MKREEDGGTDGGRECSQTLTYRESDPDDPIVRVGCPFTRSPSRVPCNWRSSKTIIRLSLPSIRIVETQYGLVLTGRALLDRTKLESDEKLSATPFAPFSQSKYPMAQTTDRRLPVELSFNSPASTAIMTSKGGMIRCGVDIV